MTSFRVELDSYRGPLDLLLYLVRKHELDVFDIPIAVVANQFLEYLEVLEQLDVNAVGDFLEMASTLIEIKSRLVLPRVEESVEAVEDPRDELVERLLDYKRYKDAASILDEQSRQWQQRYQRLANDVPPRPLDLANQPIQEVELWDLVSSFGRIVRETKSVQTSSIVYDDTPIHVYMSRIRDRLLEVPRLSFSELFQAGMHKSAMIGIFLAILELVRHHQIRTEQDPGHAEIWILASERLANSFNPEDVDNYGAAPVAGDTAEEVDPRQPPEPVVESLGSPADDGGDETDGESVDDGSHPESPGADHST